MSSTLQCSFELGQELWHIQRGLVHNTAPCLTCSGERTIRVGDETFRCPKCDGTGSRKQPEHKWYIAVSGRVGRIEATAYTIQDAARTGQPRYRVTYMLDATGIGSGSVYDEGDCFASKEEATAAMAYRNANPYTWDDEVGK